MQKTKIHLRDRFVLWACNTIINTFASRYYKAFLWLSYDLGKKEMDKLALKWANEDKEKTNTSEKANA